MADTISHYDNLIGATLILLILSLITEKVANFIKLNSTRLTIPQTSVLFENARSRDIQKRTIIIGIIVAILCKASLFTLFKPDAVFFWTMKDFETGSLSNLPVIIFGCLFTGIFLSLGSKFFHDLLDLLLEAKNLKRKLADRSKWDFDTIEEVDKYISTNDAVVVKAQVKAALDKIPGIAYYKIDYATKLVYIYATQKIPEEQINVPGVLGPTSFRVVVMKENAKEIKALATAGPGIEVANDSPYQNKLRGTAGVVVEKNGSGKQYILTCYHAVWNDTIDSPFDGFSNDSVCKIKSPFNAQVLGSLYIGVKNYKFDFALIAPEKTWTLSNMMQGGRKPKDVRLLTDNDVKNGTRLSMVSKNNPQKYNYGICTNIDCSVYLTYPDGVKRELHKLYQVESMQSNAFSVGGDSGSVILDQFDYAVGILVGGDESTTSFAIPLQSILDNYNLKLVI